MGSTVLLLYHGVGRGGQGGVACRAWFLCFLIMRRCGWCLVLVLTEHVGERGRNKGKKTKNFSSPVTRPGEEEEETVLSKNDTVLFSFFFK
jgi:hypothetical protein